MPVKKKLLHRLLGVCVQHAQPLSAALYVASLFAFVGLPLAAKRNYLDENALLAGFAHSQIRYSSAFSRGKDMFRPAVDTESDPIKLAETMLNSMRIEHWRSLPLSVQCNASTMHGILRAPRGDGKEAIVLVTPGHGSGSAAAAAGNFAAIQVAVSVLQFLQKVPWLAKDIVWVVVDAECPVLRATKDWLAAYHSCPSSERAAFGRSGLLQQALVLEMNSDRFNALQVRTLGWNGQLPMLDLYYLIKRLSESGPGLQLSQKLDTPFLDHIPAKLQHYWLNMWQVIAFSWQQATTMPTGLHAEFIRHGVDAVTIETYMQPSAVLQSAWSYGVDEGVTKLAVLLELTVRSLNNLLERFHHSTTFYLLLSPDWHVPFQVHIVPPLLLAVILVLQAADTAKLSRASCSTQDPGQVVGNTSAWLHAAKKCLYLQVFCTACKLCLIYIGDGAAVLPSWLQAMSAAWQPHSRCAIAMYATGAALAAWLVAGLCNGSKWSVQHRLYTRTVAQGIAAAQASALICTNWATAFYSLVLLVPLLSLPQCAPKWLQRAHIYFAAMLVVLLFFACFVIVSYEAYAPLMQGMHHMTRHTGSEDDMDNAPLTPLLSWRTNSLSALLTILLPACMVILQ